MINKVYFPVRQDGPGSPLCSTASATASALAQKRTKKKQKTSHFSSVCRTHLQAPLFSRAPFDQKKKIPPCLRATSQMFKRSQRGSQLSNTSPAPQLSPGLTPLCHRYLMKARVGGSEGGVGGTKCLFVGDTTLQREETCCYSDVGTSVIRG